MSSTLMRSGGRFIPCLCAIVYPGNREGMGQDPRSLGSVGQEEPVESRGQMVRVAYYKPEGHVQVQVDCNASVA